ncbi:hypothetical protein M758_7G043200 [Ceratodon purpureus]|nr:hypothetical protein M758_7G043200 [Ceratodon purpureus]
MARYQFAVDLAKQRVYQTATISCYEFPVCAGQMELALGSWGCFLQIKASTHVPKCSFKVTRSPYLGLYLLDPSFKLWQTSMILPISVTELLGLEEVLNLEEMQRGRILS